MVDCEYELHEYKSEFDEAEAYFEDVWEFPGKWYFNVSVPQGAGGRESLIRTVVRDTLNDYRTGAKPPEYGSAGKTDERI